MLTRKTKLLLSLTAAIPLLLAACTDNGIFDPREDVAGTYQLTVFANGSVPRTFTVTAGSGDPELPNGGTARIDDGTLVLRADGTFTEINNFTKTPTGEQSFQSDFVSIGTFTVNGTRIILQAPQQSGFSPRFLDGTIEFDTISYIENNFAYEYRR